MQLPLNILKKCPESGKIAMFYGFYPISPPMVRKSDLDITKNLDKEWRPSIKAALLREFYEGKTALSRLPQPLMLWMDNRATQSSAPTHKIECSLSIVNSNKSVGEALCIQAARAILENGGYKNITVRINSVGNRESVAEFERKVASFVRKKFNEFPAELRQNLKKDPFFLAKTRDDKWKVLKENSPQSIDCLSEESRIHFKEVLEFLEMLEIPFILDSTLLGDLSYGAETVFEIISEDEVLGRGHCYNRLSKIIEQKKEMPAVEVFLSLKTSRLQKVSPVKDIKHKFYLVQFGPEAKMKSLTVLENLRKAGVPVFHSLAKDKLTGQIISAEQMNIPYIILLGQKEAIDNCVTIRNTSTRSQTSVPIASLGEYIKTHL